MEQAAKRSLNQRKRGEPLAFAYYGLLLFIVVYFLRPEDWVDGMSTVPLAKMAGLLVALSLGFSFTDIRWHMPLEVVYVSLMVGQLWLAALFSPVWRGGSFNVMLDFSKVLLVIIVIYGTVRSMKRLRGILFIQSISVATIAIISLLNRHESGGRLEGSIFKMFGNSNDLALVIDLTIPLCLAFALTSGTYWKKLTWIAVMLAMIYAVFLTASRGGAIALSAASVVCVWQLGVKHRRFYLLFLVPVAVIAVSLYGGDALRIRFEHTNADAVQESRNSEAAGSAQQRKELLIQSLKITAQHPFLGVGPGNFDVVSGVWHVTHNSYTQVSSEGGIPAFVLYLLILWRATTNLRIVRRHPRAGKETHLFSMALEASLAAYLVGSFFLSLAYHLFPYYLIGYTSAILLIVRKNQRVTSSTLAPPVTLSEPEVTVWQ